MSREEWARLGELYLKSEQLTENEARELEQLMKRKDNTHMPRKQQI